MALGLVWGQCGAGWTQTPGNTPKSPRPRDAQENFWGLSRGSQGHGLFPEPASHPVGGPALTCSDTQACLGT